jgi:hypothetical protein
LFTLRMVDLLTGAQTGPEVAGARAVPAANRADGPPDTRRF